MTSIRPPFGDTRPTTDPVEIHEEFIKLDETITPESDAIISVGGVRESRNYKASIKVSIQFPMFRSESDKVNIEGTLHYNDENYVLYQTSESGVFGYDGSQERIIYRNEAGRYNNYTSSRDYKDHENNFKELARKKIFEIDPLKTTNDKGHDPDQSDTDNNNNQDQSGSSSSSSDKKQPQQPLPEDSATWAKTLQTLMGNGLSQTAINNGEAIFSREKSRSLQKQKLSEERPQPNPSNNREKTIFSQISTALGWFVVIGLPAAVLWQTGMVERLLFNRKLEDVYDKQERNHRRYNYAQPNQEEITPQIPQGSVRYDDSQPQSRFRDESSQDEEALKEQLREIRAQKVLQRRNRNY